MMPWQVVGPSCEPLGPDGWRQAASAWSSLAFVVAGVAIIVWALWLRRPVQEEDTLVPNATAIRVIMGVMAIGNGIGSLIQHGPEPWWNPIVHDPPLLGALAVMAADSFADLTGRRLRHWWWAGPTALCALLAWVWPAGSMGLSIVVAVIAVPVAGWRLWRRPAIRGWLLASLGLLAAGSLVGTLSRVGMPWCNPDSAWFQAGWSGHAVWHIAAALGMLALTPALGTRAGHPSAGLGHTFSME
ncbi:MAG: hypothetical protein FWG11_04875 [Promicromonosporaceae bacterium]|nr:hypothetical protein [Promicromonosporaceae bacterium]